VGVNKRSVLQLSSSFTKKQSRSLPTFCWLGGLGGPQVDMCTDDVTQGKMQHLASLVHGVLSPKRGTQSLSSPALIWANVGSVVEDSDGEGCISRLVPCQAKCNWFYRGYVTTFVMCVAVFSACCICVYVCVCVCVGVCFEFSWF